MMKLLLITSVISVIFCHFEMKKAGVCIYIYFVMSFVHHALAETY